MADSKVVERAKRGGVVFEGEEGVEIGLGGEEEGKEGEGGGKKEELVSEKIGEEVDT